MSKRDEFASQFERLYRAICAFSIGEIDTEPRQLALLCLERSRNEVMRGLDAREAARRQDEDARIIKLFREGRLIERDLV